MAEAASGAVSLLWRAAAPQRRAAGLVLGLTLLSALTETASLGMILPLLQVVMGTPAPGARGGRLTRLMAAIPAERQVLAVSALVGAVFLLKAVVAVWKDEAATRLVGDLRRHWSVSSLRHSLLAPLPAILRHKQGALLNSIVQEPTYASKAVRDTVDFVAQAFFCLFMTALLLSVNWRLTLATVALSFFLVGALWKRTRRSSVAAGRAKAELNHELSATVAESLAGIRQLKTFSAEERAVSHYAGTLDRLLHVILSLRRRTVLPGQAVELVIVVIVCGALLYYRYVAPSEPAAVFPVLALFIVAADRLYGALAKLLAQRMTILSEIPSLRIAHEMSVVPAPEVVASAGRPAPPVAIGVRLEEVGFAYDAGAPVLDGLESEIAAGAITALVGRTGCGKSTVCDLLARLVEPTRGRVLVDGIDLREVDLLDWRRQVGYVSQDSFLFHASLAENIRIGKPEATDDEVRRAARDAEVEEFLPTLDQGFATSIGERGTRLSGGQRQRIALARALLREPRLLLLDEATSALDGEIERRILMRLKAGRWTVLLVTHRLATLALADRILVLEDGRLVETGAYDKLIAQRGTFWRLERSARAAADAVTAN
jgi:ATP-binding cassette, subfamily B, bacterial MsbA